LELRELLVSLTYFPFILTLNNLNNVFSVRLLTILRLFDNILTHRNMHWLFVWVRRSDHTFWYVLLLIWATLIHMLSERCSRNHFLTKSTFHGVTVLQYFLQISQSIIFLLENSVFFFHFLQSYVHIFICLNKLFIGVFFITWNRFLKSNQQSIMKFFILIHCVFKKSNLIFQVRFFKEPFVIITNKLIFFRILNEQFLNFLGIIIICLLKQVHLLALLLIFGLKILKISRNFRVRLSNFSVLRLKRITAFFISVNFLLKEFFFHLEEGTLFFHGIFDHVKLRLGLFSLVLVFGPLLSFEFLIFCSELLILKIEAFVLFVKRIILMFKLLSSCRGILLNSFESIVISLELNYIEFEFLFFLLNFFWVWFQLLLL